MTTRYERLAKQVRELSSTKSGTRNYSISIETNWKTPKCKIYRTPDEALKIACLDAAKHHAEYICVSVNPFSDYQLMGDDIGYSVCFTPRPIFNHTPESFGSSILHIWSMSGTIITDLEYPQEVPKLKILDTLFENELEWVQTQTKCKTVQEYKERNEKENPDIYPKGYLTENEMLSLLYAAAGYL